MRAPRTTSAHRRRGRGRAAPVPRPPPSPACRHGRRAPAQNEGIEALVLQDGVQPLRTVAAPQHDRGQMRRVDPEGFGRRGHRHEAGADPQRRPRRQPRGARSGSPRRRATRAWPRSYLCDDEPRPREAPQPQRRVLGERSPRLWPSRGSSRPMPMSATSTAPQWARPGISRWPGFRATKVTVRVALTAMPRTAPVSPSIPEGRSTARIGRPEAFDPVDDCRAAPSMSRARPAPNSASMIRSASAKDAAPPARPDRPSPGPRPRRVARQSLPARREGTGTRHGPARPGSRPRRSRRRRSGRVRATTTIRARRSDHPAAASATAAPGPAHQLDARGIPHAMAAGVGLLHFGGGQNEFRGCHGQQNGTGFQALARFSRNCTNFDHDMPTKSAKLTCFERRTPWKAPQCWC